MSQVAYDIHGDHEPVGRKLCQVNDAARQLFLEQGFTATSMDAVARAAGVSKATLYSYFPSKEALFGHLIADECSAIQIDLVFPTLAEGLEPALRRFARQYVQLFLVAKKNSLVRVMANESTRFPDMCLRFYESGPMATIRKVAELLLEAKAIGLLAFHDPMITATQFLSLVRGDLPLRTVLGIAQLTSDNIDQEIEAGIAAFIRAYGVAPAVAVA